MKLVSIVIPTFNCAEHLPETLKSLQEQTYPHWEAICVDDGSTDKTLEIAKEFQRLDERIRVYSRTELPKGGSHCRNIGVYKAKGEFVIFLDGDDLLAAKCIEKRLIQINGSMYNFVVFPNGKYINGIFTSSTSDYKIKKYLLAYASNHAVWQTTCPIYKTDFVKSIGGFDESYPRLQDVEFNTRCIAESSGKFKVLLDKTEPDCYYRVSDSPIVFSKKYDVAYSAIPKLARLSESLYINNLISKDDFSKVCLCLTCSMIMIRKYATNKSYYYQMLSFDIRDYIRGVDKVLLYIIDKASFNEKVYYHIAHLVKYLISRLFF